jgi:hypothetical protein
MMMSVINHREDETIFIGMAVIDLFKEISETMNMSTTIRMKDLTDRICNVRIRNYHIYKDFTDYY